MAQKKDSEETRGLWKMKGKEMERAILSSEFSDLPSLVGAKPSLMGGWRKHGCWMLSALGSSLLG